MNTSTPRPPIRRNISLLATFELAGSAGSAVPTRRCFGNILELGTRGLVLEADRALEAGTPVTITVVFPGQSRTAGQDPFARLACRVRKNHDGENLHYDLSILEMDELSRERLHGYLHRGVAQDGA